MNFKNKFLFFAMFTLTLSYANASEEKKDLYCLGYVDGHNDHTMELSLTTETNRTIVLSALINRGTHQEKSCGPLVLTSSRSAPFLYRFNCQNDLIELYHNLGEDLWYGTRRIFLLGGYYPLDFDCK